MKAVYRVLVAVPEIDALPGDHVIVRPSEAVAPLQVIKQFDRHTLVRLMGGGHLDQMRLLAGELVESGGSSPHEDPHALVQPAPLRLVRGT